MRGGSVHRSHPFEERRLKRSLFDEELLDPIEPRSERCGRSCCSAVPGGDLLKTPRGRRRRAQRGVMNTAARRPVRVAFAARATRSS
jgi:hypothetical protein